MKPKTTPAPDTETVVLLDPDKVLISKLNTRPEPKPANVEGLAGSIKVSGQTSPAIVRPHPTKKGFYELIAGARRKVACKVAKVPLRAIIRKVEDKDFEDLLLVDNLQREDPDPMQEAMLIERRIKAGADPADLAARYGKSDTWLKRRMKLISLTPEARDAWCEGGAFSHFSIEMMEYVGTLDPEVQNDLADDPYEARDFGSLKELIEGRTLGGQSLEKVTWLNDPVSFVPGCGPGCKSNSAESLFPDPDHPCGVCLNDDCFKKRQSLVRDAKIADIICGEPISKFKLICSRNYAPSDLKFQGTKLNIQSQWDMERHYKLSPIHNAETQLGIDFADPNNPVICYLASRGKTSSKSSKNGEEGGESREQKLTAKRLAEMNRLLVAHLEKAPMPTSPPMLHIVAAFGTDRNRNSPWQNTAMESWASIDSKDKVTLIGSHNNKASHTREEAIWKQTIPVLRSRLGFQKNAELLAKWRQEDMKRTASLTSFDWETAWINTCTKTIPVPKSWGQGFDAITLKVTAAAQSIKSVGDAAASATKSAKKLAKTAKKAAKKAPKKPAAKK